MMRVPDAVIAHGLAWRIAEAPLATAPTGCGDAPPPSSKTDLVPLIRRCTGQRPGRQPGAVGHSALLVTVRRSMSIVD
jgi:hypothetical protein